MFVHSNNKDYYYNSNVGSLGKAMLPKGVGKWSLWNNCLLPEGPQLKMYLSIHNDFFFFYISRKLLSRVTPPLRVDGMKPLVYKYPGAIPGGNSQDKKWCLCLCGS